MEAGDFPAAVLAAEAAERFSARLCTSHQETSGRNMDHDVHLAGDGGAIPLGRDIFEFPNG